MAFENFPEADKEFQISGTQNSRNKKILTNVFTSFLVISLIATWLYILVDKGKETEKQKQTELAIADAASQRDEIRKDLYDATMRYDILKTASARKDSTISAKDRDINTKKTRIQELLSKVNATNSDLAEARKLIIALNVDIEGYKNQIELLQGEKIQLTKEKESITHQRDKVMREYDSAQEVIREKETIIETGSTLTASNFKIEPIDEKRGREITTKRARKTDKLRITFDLDENLIAKPGSKELYMVVFDPESKPIVEESLGSGIFYTIEGIEKVFTQRLDILYTKNKRQTVTFYLEPNAKFEKGNYMIEVYNNGFKVGEGMMELKKK